MSVATADRELSTADIRRIVAAVMCSFVVGVDSREQNPWRFLRIFAGAKDKHAPLQVPTQAVTLGEGDYTIVGREHEIRLERKSPEDLYSTLSHGRARFERELERLAAFPFSAVVVESGFQELIDHPRTRMSKRAFAASVIALSMRFPTRWYFPGPRPYAEAFGFRLLERWHTDRTNEDKPKRITSAKSAECSVRP